MRNTYLSACDNNLQPLCVTIKLSYDSLQVIVHLDSSSCQSLILYLLGSRRTGGARNPLSIEAYLIK